MWETSEPWRRGELHGIPCPPHVQACRMPAMAQGRVENERCLALAGDHHLQ